MVNGDVITLEMYAVRIYIFQIQISYQKPLE